MGTTRRAVSVGVISTLAMLTKIDTTAALEGDEMTIGAPAAPAHLVEYASATCPHCAQFHAANWERLEHDYVDSGRVRFTLREMATPPAAVALGMFQLARCEAGAPEEYFRRVGILFERQRQIWKPEPWPACATACFGWGPNGASVRRKLWLASTMPRASVASKGRWKRPQARHHRHPGLSAEWRTCYRYKFFHARRHVAHSR